MQRIIQKILYSFFLSFVALQRDKSYNMKKQGALFSINLFQ